MMLTIRELQVLVVLVLVFPAISAVRAGAGEFEGKMIFLAGMEENWEVVLWDNWDRPPKRLTETPWDEKHPCLSPSGDLAAWAATDGSIHVSDLKSGQTTELVLKDYPGNWESPAFSANGEKLVCSYFKPGAEDRAVLGVIDISGQSAEFVFDQYCPQFSPARSPAGNRLAYACTHCTSSCGRIIQEIWMADLESGQSRQLAMTNAHCDQPAWAPDGSMIAFSADIKGSFDIWYADTRTGSLTQVTDHSGLDKSPAFSPDGRSIAFISTRSGKSAIYLKDLDTGDVEKLEPFGGRDIEYRSLDWK